MYHLPIEPITPYRAFEKVGIDFSGPITTKCQHTRKASNFKSYICLFICMSTKAVHLELISSLSEEAFLSALRQFVSRRRYPSGIYSDNGTNFVGASAYLRDLFELLHISNVQIYSPSKNIQWHFIPPYAPNFGGVCEASLKLIKHNLLKTLKVDVLNFEKLATILCQIEACISLYSLSSDPKNLQVVSSDEVEKDVLVSLAALLPQHLRVLNRMDAGPERPNGTISRLHQESSLFQHQMDSSDGLWPHILELTEYAVSSLSRSQVES
ncbi:integrase catalytic domain-containing protein [Trichonephila clavipes]|nr:integrase catalytic domain-containing protein [Trichonephila clavipes]